MAFFLVLFLNSFCSFIIFPLFLFLLRLGLFTFPRPLLSLRCSGKAGPIECGLSSNFLFPRSILPSFHFGPATFGGRNRKLPLKSFLDFSALEIDLIDSTEIRLCRFSPFTLKFSLFCRWLTLKLFIAF